MVFPKSYSLENSLQESIFREDLLLHNCLQQPSSSDASVKCNGCGVLLDDKYMLPSHIKRVHMKVSGSVTLIACPTPQCSYRHLSQDSANHFS